MFAITFAPKVTWPGYVTLIPQTLRSGALTMGLLLSFFLLHATGGGGGTSITIQPPSLRQYGAADSTIVLSPNPASEQVTASPGADVFITKFYIRDYFGNTLFTTSVSGEAFVEVNLEAGNYLFQFDTSLGTITKPMVIQ